MLTLFMHVLHRFVGAGNPRLTDTKCHDFLFSNLLLIHGWLGKIKVYDGWMMLETSMQIHDFFMSGPDLSLENQNVEPSGGWGSFLLLKEAISLNLT